MNANNTIIRESAKYLFDGRITADGFYRYNSIADGNNYILKLTSWTDSTSTIKWSIIVVSPFSWDSDALSAAVDSAQLTNCVATELTAFMNDAIYPAKYLSFFSGTANNIPLSSPILSTVLIKILFDLYN